MEKQERTQRPRKLRTRRDTMQPSFFLATVLAATLTLATATVTLAQSNPATVVMQSVQAINRGDVASALALYAPNAIIDWGALCEAAPCVSRGKAMIQKQLERQVANKQRVGIALHYVSGDIVTSMGSMSSDTTKKAGIRYPLSVWNIAKVSEEGM